MTDTAAPDVVAWDRAELIARLRQAEFLDRASDDQIGWLVDNGRVERWPADTEVIPSGASHTGLFLLVDGELRVLRELDGNEFEVSRTNQVGSWAGSIPIVNDESLITLATIEPSDLLHLEQERFDEMVYGGFPITHHLLAGITRGVTNFEQRRNERERLAGLGMLSAGLAHELNNPASAARSGAARLANSLAELAERSARLGSAASACNVDGALACLQEQVQERAGAADVLTGLERAEAEDELADRLADLGADDVDPGLLVDAGIDDELLAKTIAAAGDAPPAELVRWLAAAASAFGLTREIEISTARIGELVGAVKRYSYLDRDAGEAFDLNEGLKATMAVMWHKLPAGVKVTKELADDIGPVPGHGGEMNQVWTNLFDNALHAVGDDGAIRIRSWANGGEVRVSIADDGAGMPEDVRRRALEPFFTTKPPGVGTGLGLDIVRRIVVDGHGGDLTIDSAPGEGTTVTVCLPR